MNLGEKIINWLKKQVSSAGAKGLVVGMSGGVDSSVAAVLAKRVFPDNMLGLIMPCFSSELDKEYALLVAKKFKIYTKIVPLTTVFIDFFSRLEGHSYTEDENSLAVSNMKPRLRMISLYYFANKLNYLVVGTGNKSELTMGYFTKYGDGGVDLLPLGNLLKTQVLNLAKELDIPEDIIGRTPTAGLWMGQTDEKEMGITYRELDRAILSMESCKIKKSDFLIINKIKEKFAKSAHKRSLPPVFVP